jgi:hypothetical protein
MAPASGPYSRDIFRPILLPKPEDRLPPPNLENDKEQQSKEKKKRFWLV